MLLRILPFQDNDIDEMTAIENNLFSNPWSKEALASSCRQGNAWIMKDSSEVIIGYLIGEEVLDEFFIYNFAIKKEFQRQGLGQKFLSYLLNSLEQRKFWRIILEVRSQNSAALNLYKKKGFKAMYIRNNYYQKPVDNAVVMVYLFNGK